jgi:hypothetical protein
MFVQQGDPYGLNKWASNMDLSTVRECMGHMLEMPTDWREDKDLVAMHRIWVKRFGEDFTEGWDDDNGGYDDDDWDIDANVEEILRTVKNG